MIRKSITILVLVGLWWIAALSMGRAVILPLPFDVFKHMLYLTTTSSFYVAISSTLGRVTISFLLSMILGILLGIFAGLYKKFEQYISPVMSFLQTIPQIAYILILLVWFKHFTALIMIILLMLLPVFYNNAKNGIQNIDAELMDVIALYHPPFIYTFFKVYIPLIKGYILSAIDTCLPLGFKVAVMAEIFVQTNKGIGTSLYFARTQIDMISIFAWTLWMVLLLSCIIEIFRFVRTKFQ